MIIIPGMPKSGTTYLTHKLARAGATMFKERQEHYEDTVLLDKLIEAFVQEYRFDKWWAFDHSKALQDRVREILKGQKTGFKNPRLIGFLPLIGEMFPDAKIVICTRSFSDWSSSVSRHKSRHMDEIVNYYWWAMDYIEWHKKGLGAHVVHYNTFDTAGEQRSLNKYLGMRIKYKDFKPRKIN